MGFAPLYLLNRFAFRLSDFFHHWYIDGSRVFGHGFISLLAAFDRTFALRVTLHYFWKPLYGDYSVIGRILGIIFRTIRIIIAVLLYAVCTLFFGVTYLVWLSVPFLLLSMVYLNFIKP